MKEKKLSGKTLVALLPPKSKKNSSLSDAVLKNKYMDGNKYKVNGEYYRYDEAFFDYYDNVIFLPDEKAPLTNAFAVLKDGVSSCDCVDFVLFNSGLLNGTTDYSEDFKTIIFSMVQKNAYPRIVLFGNKTDSFQLDVNKTFDKETASKINVFGTPWNMKAELACGFRQGNLFIVELTESVKVTSKNFSFSR